MSTTFLIKFLAIAGGLTTASFNNNLRPCKAEIIHTREEHMDVFQGIYYNNLDEPIDGNYTLETIKESKSGRSVSRQGGSFSVKGMAKKKLSRSSINLEPESTWKVVLKIYSENILICTDSVEVKADSY